MGKLEKTFSILVLFTIFTFCIGWFKIESSLIIAVLLITTFFKGYLIIEYFMGLHEVQGKYRYIPTIWLATIISLIASVYYL
jgi:hypothetical protein